jgi:hypothetical protein
VNNPPLAPRSATRYLWILVAFFFSLVVALIAGILRASTGTGLAETILYGDAAFAASMGLCLAVLSAAGQL